MTRRYQNDVTASAWPTVALAALGSLAVHGLVGWTALHAMRDGPGDTRPPTADVWTGSSAPSFDGVSYDLALSPSQLDSASPGGGSPASPASMTQSVDTEVVRADARAPVEEAGHDSGDALAAAVGASGTLPSSAGDVAPTGSTSALASAKPTTSASTATASTTATTATTASTASTASTALTASTVATLPKGTPRTPATVSGKAQTSSSAGAGTASPREPTSMGSRTKSPAPPSSGAGSTAPGSSGGPGASSPGANAAFGMDASAQQRDLGRAFTRALKDAGHGDASWARLTAGTTERAEVGIEVDGEGKITGSAIRTKAPSAQMTEIVRRTIAMLRFGVFALRESTTSAGTQVVRLVATTTDVDPASVQGGTTALGYEYERGKGAAHFTQPSGRHVDIQVEVVRVEGTK